MAAAEPPEGQAVLAPADLEADAALAVYPPVVAVVVTRNPGAWFDETLASLAAQDYPDLTVLVVDCGSDDDPTTRVASALPGAFVRRLDRSAGFPEAANESLRAVEGATFLLVCHDDVVLDSGVVRILVEEAYRSNAGVLGPKIVDADNPEILVEVGRSIDRFGASYTGIEPGEVDQEQHDGVRDVFYVSSATMLVRRDLFAELGGFDPATFPGAEDLDLCWRARLAGARVLVAPDARVAHRQAADARTRADRPDDVALARTRVRVLLTAYSLRTLLWLVPVGVLVGCIESIAFILTGRHRRARAVIGAWFANFRHPARLRAARRRVQALRRIHDAELRELQVGSGMRLREFFVHHLHSDQRLRNLSRASRDAMGNMSEGLHRPATAAFLGFVVLLLFGSRDLLTRGVPSVGDLAAWPGIHSLFDAYGSAWRFTGLGSSAPAPPALALMGALGTVLFGAVGLARTLFVVAAIPFGVLGAYRLSRSVISLRGPALAAALAYGINPAPRNAIALGRLGPLVAFAVLPFLLHGVLRAAGLGEADQPGRPSPARPGRILRIAVLAALGAAFYPAILGLFVLGVAALVLVAPFTRSGARAVRALGISVAASLLAVILLLPWPLAYVRSGTDAASLGFAFRPRLGLGDVLRFHSGPQGSGFAMWGLLGAAALPLLVATGPRLTWAARGWALALVGWGAVWLPARFATGTSVLAPEAGLTLAALGVALALGAGVAVLVDGIRRFHFGWRQPAALLGGLALALPALGFMADSVNGSWHAPDTDWAHTLAFTGSQATKGQFRLLWLGDPAVLPLDPVVLPDGLGYTLTRNGPGDATQLLRAPVHDADRLVADAIELTAAQRTNRLGRLLAPMGVRYIALPAASGPSGGVRAARTPGLGATLDEQLDLARLRAVTGLRLYENLAWVPMRAVVTGKQADAVPVGSKSPTLAALGADLAGATALGSGPRTAGTVLFSEAYSTSWHATAGDHALRHLRTFGWANGYALSSRGAVSITNGAQWQRWAWLALEVAIWALVVLRWRRTRTRRRLATARPDGPRRDGDRSRRRERRPDPLVAGLDDDDRYWWERV